MESQTVHVIPAGDGWAVHPRGERRQLFSSQTAAIKAARAIVKSSKAGRLVVIQSDGQILRTESHGLPKLKKPLHKSRLGTKTIEKAVGRIILDRLNSDPAQSGA